MNTCTKPRMLVLSIAAAALVGATVVVIAQRASTVSVPVCVKDNGQVRVLTAPEATCDPAEQRYDWVIGGEVTDIALGQGLIGSRENGTVHLAVDPSLLQTCTGCRGGRIFSGYSDGPVPMPTGLPREIARLELPEGYFAMFAKMTVTNTLDEGFDDRVLCRLSAGADFDDAELVLSEDPRTVIAHPYNAAATLSMQLVHHFSVSGATTLSCYEQDSESDLSYQDLKIVAIEGSSVSNVFVGSD